MLEGWRKAIVVIVGTLAVTVPQAFGVGVSAEAIQAIQVLVGTFVGGNLIEHGAKAYKAKPTT